MNAVASTPITLDAIKAEHARLAKLISDYERQPFKFELPQQLTFPKLNEGEKYIGVIVSADGTKREHITLLPQRFQGNWKSSIEWAASVSGELFDRVEGALLFALCKSGYLKDEFQEEAYWTREQHAADSGYAWSQGFGDGSQGYWSKSHALRARAVRRSPI